MESRHVSVADGISRILSLLAILVALGSAVFLYQDNQRLKTDLASIKSSPTDPEVFKTHAEEWDKKLRSALAEFVERANTVTTQFDKAREARNEIMSAATDLAPGVGEQRVREIVDMMLADLELPNAEPELIVAQTVMRPGKNGERPIPKIRNAGNVEAEIRIARFKPTQGSVFAVQSPVELEEDHVVIEFDPSHNLGADPGYHRYYERTYLFPEQVVPSKKTVQVTIEIQANGEHLDWGMTGDLELEYQNGNTVLIPNARAIFVADKEKTT